MNIYIILVFSFFNILNVKAQNINDLMNNFDNRFAAEHLEMFTRPNTEPIVRDPDKVYISSGGIHQHLSRNSIKLTNLDSNFLNDITTIVRRNPESIFPFLDTETHSLAAFLLLSHIFQIDVPSNSSSEGAFLNMTLDVLLVEENINRIQENMTIPRGEDPSKYILNDYWSRGVSSIATTRIREAVLNL